MATKTDVRVRLSAEGQQEVVNAFRRVQTEAAKSKQSAVDASAGFDALKDAAHRMALEFLGFEAALKVFEGIKTAVESSILLATTIEKMEQKTGLAAETLQVFVVAAKRLGIEQESVNKGLGLFAKSMGLLATGAPKATNAVKALFGSADALKGLTTDQQLLKVTDALGKMEAGGKKAYIATQLFGRGGLELIPVLDELSGKGFEATKKKLEELGVAMSDDFVANAHRAEQAIGDLKLASQGIAIQFSSGFLPALTDVAEGFAGAGSKGGSAMKELGREAGEAMKSGILFFGTLAISLQELGNKAIAVGKVIWESSPVARGLHAIRGEHVPTVPELWVGLKDDWSAASANARLQIDALGDIVAEKVQENVKKIKPAGPDGSGAEMTARAKAALAKANLEFAKARSEEELAIYKEANRVAVEDEKARWKAGTESASEYYSHLRTLAAEAADHNKAEIDAEIRLQEGALKAQTDPAKRVEIQKTISELKTKASIADMAAAEMQIRLVREESDEQKKLGEEILGFQAKVDEARGKGHAKELEAIDREAEKFRKDLIQAGESDVDAKVAEFSAVLKAQADFKTAENDAQQLLRTMEIERKNIELSAAAGLISETEKKRELIKLEHDRLPGLQAQLKLMQDIARQSGLPELITQTDEWGLKLREAALQTEAVEHKTKDLGRQLGQALGKDMTSFFSHGIAQAHTFGDAMRSLGQSVVSSLNQMFQQLILKMIQAKLQARLTGGGGGAGGFFGFLSSMIGGAVKKERGGPIHGPSGTDVIPAWLTAGEYVVKRSAAQQPGTRALLDAINFGMGTPPLARSRGPHYAAGGEVTSGGMVLGAGGKNSSAELTVGLDYGLVIKSLEAHPSFGKVVVRHLSENRKAANTALGK